jgi:chemotaxis protein methyltransferase WspC
MQPDFEGLLREAIGLDANSIGSSTLDRAVKARMTSLGIVSAEHYWDCLQGVSDELQELIEAVVVPETWFFRDREAFSAMVRLLSGPFLSASANLQVRILSVPCCTGEEPYSIAMALLEAGLPSNYFAIDAVDVSRPAVVRARRGVYGTNSFRGDDLGFRDRYMERVGERYRVREDIRRVISFYQDNLFANSFRRDAAPYDVIFCRNVLIYFDREKQELALEKLKRLLKPKGYLFVGPAEAVLASRNGFRPLNETMSFAFAAEQRPPAARPVLNLPQLKPAVTERLLSSPAFNPAISISAMATPLCSTMTKIQVDIARIQNLADANQFEQALALCQTYLDENAPTAEVCYIRGLIHDAKNERASAIEWYRKVVYLEPGHSEALLHLALLYEREGNPEAAAQLRQRAKRSVMSDNRAISASMARGNSK